MCLLSKNILPTKAKEDITVYKVCFKYKSHTSSNFYFSIYLKSPVIKGEYMYSQVSTYKLVKYIIRSFIGRITEKQAKYTCITKHAVHAFSEMYSAELIKNHLSKYTDVEPYNLEIVKCTIPKGTYYWVGKEGDIAARKLYINE